MNNKTSGGGGGGGGGGGLSRAKMWTKEGVAIPCIPP